MPGMTTLAAYLEERKHRHTWGTRVALTDGCVVELCPCGAMRRVEDGEGLDRR